MAWIFDGRVAAGVFGMRRIFTLVAGLVVVGMLSSAVLAAEKTEKKDAKDAPMKKDAPITGQIIKIDGKTLTLAKKKDAKAGEEQVIKVNDKTKVLIEGETPAAEKKEGEKKPAPKMTEGKIEDLKVGQMVRVTATEGVASKIEIRKAQAAKKEMKEVKEEKEEKKATK
jgi:hypothetical protein